MTLRYEKTTEITDALENSTEALVAVLGDLTQRAEELISDATRDGGAHATAANVTAGVARLTVSWLQGASKMTSLFLDNLVLLTHPQVRGYRSDLRTFRPENRPTAARNWLIRVDRATTAKQGDFAASVKIFTDDGRAISTTSPNPSPLDERWNGKYIVRPQVPGLLPSLVDLTLQAVDAADTSVTIGDPVTDVVGIFPEDMTQP